MCQAVAQTKQLSAPTHKFTFMSTVIENVSVFSKLEHELRRQIHIETRLKCTYGTVNGSTADGEPRMWWNFLSSLIACILLERFG